MDRETGQWGTLGRTRSHRTDHTSWLSPDGLMLIGGDYDHENSTEMFSLQDGTSTPHYELQYSGRGACLIPDDSTFILTSGTDVSRYDSLGWVESLPRMMQFRNWHGCGSYQADSGETILLVAGGWDMTQLSFLSSVETLTLGASVWNFAPALPREMSNIGAASLDNKVFMVGGFNREETFGGKTGIPRENWWSDSLNTDHSHCRCSPVGSRQSAVDESWTNVGAHRFPCSFSDRIEWELIRDMCLDKKNMNISVMICSKYICSFRKYQIFFSSGRLCQICSFLTSKFEVHEINYLIFISGWSPTNFQNIIASRYLIANKEEEHDVFVLNYILFLFIMFLIMTWNS